MTIWIYVKTNDSPKSVGDMVCAHNVFVDAHPKGKYSWVMKPGKDEEDFWQIRGKYEDLEEELSNIAIVYRAGDAVVLGEVDDTFIPNFLDPLLVKYGLEHIKWLTTVPKR